MSGRLRSRRELRSHLAIDGLLLEGFFLEKFFEGLEGCCVGGQSSISSSARRLCGRAAFGFEPLFGSVLAADELSRELLDEARSMASSLSLPTCAANQSMALVMT